MLECMARDLFGGGMETVQVTLIFGLLLLANRPHILKKVNSYEIKGYAKRGDTCLTNTKQPYVDDLSRRLDLHVSSA